MSEAYRIKSSRLPGAVRTVIPCSPTTCGRAQNYFLCRLTRGYTAKLGGAPRAAGGRLRGRARKEMGRTDTFLQLDWSGDRMRM